MSKFILAIAACVLIFASSPEAIGSSFYVQEEKTVWIRITDTRGRPLSNITVSSVEGGKAVRTTSSGKAGVPVPGNFQIQQSIQLVVRSKEYQTANGLPFAIRIAGFNKPYLPHEITLVARASRSANRSQSPRSPYPATDLDPFSKGEQAVTAQKYQEAFQYFSKAYEERKQVYERSKSARPKARYVEATRRLGGILIVLNKWQDALEKFQEVLRIEPSDDDSSYFLGLCSMMLGDLPQAEKAFRNIKGSGRDSMAKQLGGLMMAAIHEFYGKLESSIALERDFFRHLSEEGLRSAPEINSLSKLVGKLALDNTGGESYPSRIQPVSRLALSITFKSDLAFSEKREGQFSPGIVTPLNELATIFLMLERYEEAEKLIIRTMSLERRLFGDDHLSVGLLLTRIASLEARRNDYVASENHYREAATILKKTLGNDTSLMTIVQEGLARLFVKQERFQEAERELLSQIELSCKPDIIDTVECISALGQLAGFYYYRERYADAIVPLRRAIDISKKLWAAKDSTGTALILEQLDDLEDLYEETGDKQALEALEKEREYIISLGITPKEVGKTTSSTGEATTYVSLDGRRCLSQAEDEFVKYPRSKELLEASVQAGKYLDYRDPDLHQAMYLLAYLYYGENRRNEAVALADKALKANEDALQPDRARAAYLLNLKGLVESDRHNYVEAEKQVNEALKTMQVVMGQNHETTVPFLLNLGVIQRLGHNYVEAEKNLRLALNIREKSPSDAPSCGIPDSIRIASELAVVYVQMQRFAEAEKLFTDSLRAIGDCCLDRHPAAVFILESYAESLRRMGRNDEAAKQEARAKQLKTKQ